MCLDQLITGLQAEIKGIPNTQEDTRASIRYNVTYSIYGTNKTAKSYMGGTTVMTDIASIVVALAR